MIVDGHTAAGRRIVAGVVRFAQEQPAWSLHVDLCPLQIGTADDTADGTVFASRHVALLDRFLSGSRPAVGCLAHVEGVGTPVVRSDDEAIGRLAARYFLERGFERFVYDCMEDRSLAARLRWQGFSAAVGAAGFAARWRRSAAAEPDSLGSASLPEGGPVAVFAGHDAVARELAREMIRQGIAIPDQVALLGVDDDDLQCLAGRPELSSIAIPYEEIGWQAACLLDGLLAGRRRPAAPFLVPPLQVVTRTSSDIVCTDDPRLSAALRHIREHACDPAGVKHAAAAAHVSRRWLEQQCRRKFGHSPHAAILRVRMERAKVLLRDRTLPLKEVAARCGYPLPQNFNTAFRKTTGISPGAYRRRLPPSS